MSWLLVLFLTCNAVLASQEKDRAPSQCLMTVTVGSKPSDADAWLPSVDAVVSLLKTLARVVSWSFCLRRPSLSGVSPR